MAPPADTSTQMRGQKALLDQAHWQHIFYRRADEFLINHAAHQKSAATLSDEFLNHLQLIGVKKSLLNITENQSFVLVELFL